MYHTERFDRLVLAQKEAPENGSQVSKQQNPEYLFGGVSWTGRAGEPWQQGVS